jgi:non-specific serine/threonine protein kinase
MARAHAHPIGHPRHNLPPPRTALIGREHDIGRVRHLVQAETGRLVTLTGAGGCGKTRLAYAVAADAVGLFPDGVRLIELAFVTDPLLVPQAVTSALGVRERPGRPLLDALLRYLVPRQLLLVVDNCEHLISACAELVDRVLQACPSVRVLATSREPLRIAGEVTWRVPSLAAPESVRLFAARAQAVQPIFELTPRNAPAVAAICARLEGLPLAIELAAAWERALGVEEIVARLADTFGLLVGGSRTAPTRQQTMWATLDWSHALLVAPEQALFRRLAVFAGGWDLAAAESVCAGGEVAPGDVLALLTRLVDTSLAVEAELDGHARYRLLEPVRAFAADHLTHGGEADATRRAHAAFFLERAAQLASVTLDDPRTARAHGQRLDQLERDYQNFNTALQWLAEQAPIESALRLANVLAELWQRRGRLNEGRAWLTRLLHQPGDATRTRARALGWAGNFAWLQGDPIAARALHEQTLAIDQAIGDDVHTACVLNALGRDALALGDYPAAERLLEDALGRFQALGVGEVKPGGVLITFEEMWTRYSLGLTAYEQMDWARAHAHLTRCLEQATAFGSGGGGSGLWLQKLASNGLARVAHQRGDSDRARRLYEQALAKQRALDDPASLASTLVGLGLVRLDLHDPGGARAALTESVALFEDLGDPSGLARALDAFAVLSVMENQPERAWRLAGAAERLRAAGRTPLSPADQAELARRLGSTRRVLGDEAVATLKASGAALSGDQAVALARSDAEARATPATSAAAQAVLTAREREVAALVGRGLSNRQIAETLVITRRTAAAHVGHILAKLGFTSRTQVGIWAAEHDLLA